MTVSTDEPKSLRDAHDAVAKRLPPDDAKPAVWLAFRLSNARLYKTIADVDRGHHHEAMYWVRYEERKAGEISAKPEATHETAD